MMKKIMRVSAIILILLSLTLGIAIWLLSPKQTRPFTDQSGQLLNNSVAEILDLEVNGFKQRLLIRGEDRSNPVLLHLHGGPGGPDQAMILGDGNTVEDLFTVVYWDQRGAGASFTKSMTAESLNVEQLVADGLFIAEYLRERFAKNKIYLQGHSWGTFLGVHMATTKPKLFHAYFGIGQVAKQRKAELLSYNYTLEQATKAGDQTTVDQLKQLGSPPYNSPEAWLSNVLAERVLMRPYEYPGDEMFMDNFDLYKYFILHREYSITEKLNALDAANFSLNALWMDVVNADFFETHLRFSIPVYIFQGQYDMHTVTEVAKDYFDQLQAPHKEYHLFDQSAHWPHLKQHSQYRQVLEQVIGGNP